MKTIYKYALPVTDHLRILLPRGADILSVQEKDGQVFMWALVDTDRELVNREFVILGTGQPIPDTPVHLTFIGTFQIKNLGLVYHVFEVEAS